MPPAPRDQNSGAPRSGTSTVSLAPDLNLAPQPFGLREFDLPDLENGSPGRTPGGGPVRVAPGSGSAHSYVHGGPRRSETPEGPPVAGGPLRRVPKGPTTRPGRPPQHRARAAPTRRPPDTHLCASPVRTAARASFLRARRAGFSPVESGAPSSQGVLLAINVSACANQASLQVWGGC